MNTVPGFESHILLTILCLVYFTISFFNLDVGIVLISLAMLFSPEISVGSTDIRSVVVRVEDLLIIVLSFAWVAQIAIRRNQKLFLRTPMNAPIFSLLLLSFLSSCWGIARGWVIPLTSMFYLVKTIEFFMIFFLISSYVRSERKIRLFIFFAIVTVTLVGVYALTQVPTVEIFSDKRITAPFEGNKPEPATIGGYMAFLLLIIISLTLYEKDNRMRWVYGVLGLIILVPFLYTLNRTSYAAFLGGLVVISIIEKRKWLRYVLLALLIASPLWLPPSIKDRIAYTWNDARNPGRELGVDQSFQERIYSFKTVWNNLKSSPLIGQGVTSYYSDNQYARTLNEIGIIGLGLWIWIFVRLFKISIWLYDWLDGGFLKGLVLGYRAGLVGLLVHAFGAPTFYIVRIMEPFWFLSGLVMALYLLKVKEAKLINP